MKLIVCLGDDGGMMFNHRRQSRDRILVADIVRHVKNTPLWVSPYSAPLFEGDCPMLCTDAVPAQSARMGDYCFVEDTPLPQTVEDIEELIIYRWNRLYPSDTYFTCDTSSFVLRKSTDFSGSSHDKITKEVWTK